MYGSEFDWSGIRIRSRPRRLQFRMDDWNNSNSHPLDEWGFAQPQHLFKILIGFYCVHFTSVLITSHPLKTFRITDNNTQLLYGIKWYICAPPLMVQYFPRNDHRPSFHVVNRWHFSFCEELHSRAIRRKCDSTCQDSAFFKGRFATFGGKK